MPIYMEYICSMYIAIVYTHGYAVLYIHINMRSCIRLLFLEQMIPFPSQPQEEEICILVELL